MKEVVKNRDAIGPTSTSSSGGDQSFARDGNGRSPLTAVEVIALAVVALLALIGIGPVLLILAVV